MLRALGLRVAAIGVGLGAAGLLAEAALRVAGADHEPGSARLVHSANPDLGYRLAPGARARHVAINSLGFRGGEVTPRKPEGVRRIVVLGDSVAFGLGLGPQPPFPALLEGLLSEAGTPAEVLNLGVPGYDVLGEVALLEEVALDLRPDLVLVAFCINDVGVHTANARAVPLTAGVAWLVERSALVRLVFARIARHERRRHFVEANEDAAFRERYRDRITPLDDDVSQLGRLADLESLLRRIPAPAPAFADWYASPYKIGRLRWCFERLARRAEERGFDVRVAILPYLDEAGRPEIYRRVYDVVEHEASRVGFGVDRLRDLLAAGGLAALRQRRGGYEDPIHPNAAGHRLIARALFDAIRGS